MPLQFYRLLEQERIWSESIESLQDPGGSSMTSLKQIAIGKGQSLQVSPLNKEYIPKGHSEHYLNSLVLLSCLTESLINSYPLVQFLINIVKL